MRISRVYTKSGDQGETSLVDGSRVSKADLRVASYGDVDELNSLLGLTRIDAKGEFDRLLARIQNELFIIGADLASPADANVPRTGESLVVELEQSIDHFNNQLEPLSEFILPGGGRLGATLHLARAVARRAERAIVALAAREPINPAALKYLNRLSDLLFVMARLANKHEGLSEELADFSQRAKRSERTKDGG